MKRLGGLAFLVFLATPCWAIHSKTGGGGGGSSSIDAILNQNTLQDGASFYVRQGTIDSGDTSNNLLLINDGSFGTSNNHLVLRNTGSCADDNQVAWSFELRGGFGFGTNNTQFGTMRGIARDAQCGGGAPTDGSVLFTLKRAGTLRDLFEVRGGSDDIHIGAGVAGVDYGITVDGENNDGTLKFMEDENEWRFSQDVTINGTSVCQEDGTNCPASGGGASSLAVGSGTYTNYTTQVTSPTAVLSFMGNQFRVLAAGTTSIVIIDTTTSTGLLPKDVAATTYQPLDLDLTDLADGSLTGSKVGDGVPAANIAAGSLDTDVIASSVAANAVKAEQIAADVVGASELDEAMNFTPTGAWDFGGATSLEMPNGTAPTVDATGEFAVDTTSGQFVFFNGTSADVFQATTTKSMILETPVAGDYPFFFKAQQDITLQSIVCVSSAATSTTIQLEECNANGAACTTIESGMVCATTEVAVVGSGIDDQSILAGARIRAKVTATSGTPGWVAIDVGYTLTRK